MCELLENLTIPIKGIIDSNPMTDSCCSNYQRLGDDQWLLGRGIKPGESRIVISPDAPHTREKLYTAYRSKGFEFPKIVSGNVSKYCHIGEATVIQQMAYVSANCQLGVGVKVNVGSKVMHDVKVGDFTTIAPAAVVLGNVSIGKRVYIGANSTILPNISIEDDAIVGAGAVVTKDVKTGAIVKGIPAR